jgi:hypothetical protein
LNVNQYQNLLPVFTLSENIRDLDPKHGEYLKTKERIYQKINEAIISSQPFNASAFSHRMFTEVIRDYVNKPYLSLWRQLLNWLLFWRRLKPIFLPIIYNDGGEAKPFPLFSLSRISQPKGFPIIKVGLMSMRHPELDSLVDAYLLRNRQVDRKESCAEQDDIAYNRTTQFLSELLKEKKEIEIHLYHTGLEPVVVGTYRAITEVLQKHQGQLVIIPKFPVVKKGGLTGYTGANPWF